MWIVKLTGDDQNQAKAFDIWDRSYFPRKFSYKRDATSLLDDLKKHGILADASKVVGMKQYNVAKTIPSGPTHVGTWVFEINNDDFTKWGKDQGTEFPFPPDNVDAVKFVEGMCQVTENTSRFYLAHLFDNGQMKQFEFEPLEHGIDVDPKPATDPNADLETYEVEALEQFMMETTYSVEARSEDEAMWLVRNGQVVADKTTEQGETKFIHIVSCVISDNNE